MLVELSDEGQGALLSTSLHGDVSLDRELAMVLVRGPKVNKKIWLL